MLSQHQIDKFFADGYLVVDLYARAELLDDILQETATAYPDRANGQFHHGTRLTNFWRDSYPVCKLALLPEVMEILEDLYLRRPLPFQTLNFPVGTEQPLHADTIHFNSFPRNFLCGVMVALEDVEADNGPEQYCRGTHLLPEITMQDVGKGIAYENYKHYEAYVAELVKQRQLQPEIVTLKKGQALIGHGNLLHGGSPQRDKARTRHTQLTHYFFEGCRYYNPMLSTPENIHVAKPRWIALEPAQAAKSKLDEVWGKLLNR